MSVSDKIRRFLNGKKMESLSLGVVGVGWTDTDSASLVLKQEETLKTKDGTSGRLTLSVKNKGSSVLEDWDVRLTCPIAALRDKPSNTYDYGHSRIEGNNLVLSWKGNRVYPGYQVSVFGTGFPLSYSGDVGTAKAELVSKNRVVDETQLDLRE